MALQVRRGTNAERLTITPAEGELIYVTDTKQLFVGDGSTAGGTTTIADTIDSVLADTTPQLGGNLDLNNFNITGTGNIDITGTIQATGNINLGDGAGGDVISVGGVMSGNLVPDTDAAYDLGSSSAFWKEAFISQLTVDNQISAERIQLSTLVANDSTVIIDTATGVVNANLTGNVTGNVVGDVKGSVFADDSSVMVDANNRILDAQTTNSYFVNVNALLTQNRTVNGQGQINVRRLKTDEDVSLSPLPMGSIIWDFEDINGISASKSLVQGGNNYIRFTQDANGISQATTPASNSMAWYDSKLVVGARSPYSTELLQVKGNARIDGTVQIGTYADASARDSAVTGVAGMLVFLTDGDGAGNPKFQGYTGTAWVDLN